MKKLFLNLVVLCTSVCTFAQIEEYVEKPKVVNNTLTKEKYLYYSPHPDLRGMKEYENPVHNKFYDLKGLHLYSTNTLRDVYNETIPLWIPAYNPKDNTLRVTKVQKGQTFEVVDVLLLQSEVRDLRSKLFSATIIGDDAVYKAYVIFGFAEKEYKFQINNILPYLSTHDIMANPIYILKGEDGNEYFIRNESDKYKSNSWIYPLNKKGESMYSGSEWRYLLGIYSDLTDFICVETYNFIKNRYEGEEIANIDYSPYSYDWDSKSYIKSRRTNGESEIYIDSSNVWVCQQVSVRENQIVLSIYQKGVESDILPWEVTRTYKTEVGYKHDSLICFGPSYCLRREADSIAQKYILEQNETQKQKMKEQLDYKKKLVEKYGATNAQLILDEKVVVGMTADMVREAKGAPCRTTTSTDASGAYEVWVYNCFAVEYLSNDFMQFNYEYISLRNGKVIRITK